MHVLIIVGIRVRCYGDDKMMMKNIYEPMTETGVLVGSPTAWKKRVRSEGA